MRRFIAAVIFLSLFLTACSIPSQIPPAPIQPPTQPSEEAAIESSAATEVPTEPATEATLPEHSPLYISGVTVEDVIRYFNEVTLDAEFSIDGDATLVQKWGVPVRYIIDGAPTPEDLSLLTSYTQWLNTIEGFPGIAQANTPEEANLQIHFCSEDEMLNILGESLLGCDGGVTYWYENHLIYKEIICCRTDLDQHLRNSVIKEEIYNGLGPVQDTQLRPDSIIYSEFSEPQELTDIDELILKLLYHPDIKCGMNATECEIVIRTLYY